MPELAETALYARDLNKITAYGPLEKVMFHNQINWGRTIIPLRVRRKILDCLQHRIWFTSSGKALYLHADELAYAPPVLQFRLAMTGRFLKGTIAPKWKPHCFLTMKIGATNVFYVDHRRFGRLTEPIESEWSLGGYSANSGLRLKKSIQPPNGFLTKPRISWLLATGHLTGVGNYMANEALGRLHLSPFDDCRSKDEAIALLRECQTVAKQSFQSSGNSFSSGFYLLSGEKGRYLTKCQFYGNEKTNYYLFRGRPVYTKFRIPKKWS